MNAQQQQQPTSALVARTTATGPLSIGMVDVLPYVPADMLNVPKYRRRLVRLVRLAAMAVKSGYWGTSALGHINNVIASSKDSRLCLAMLHAARRESWDYGTTAKIWQSFIKAHPDMTYPSQKAIEHITYATSDLRNVTRYNRTKKDELLSRGNLKDELSRAEAHLWQTRPARWTKETHWLLPYLATKKFAPGQCYGIEIEFLLERQSRPQRGPFGRRPQHAEDCDAIDSDGDSTGDYCTCGADCGDGKCFTQEDLRDAGIMGASLHEDGSVGTTRDDEGTLCTNPDGDEIGIMVLRQDPKRLKMLCDFLQDHDATVNKSCGLHVHLDCRDVVSREEALGRARRLAGALPWLATLQPKSRIGNRYCQLRMSEQDRYSAVNFTAYDEHKTVEVRLGAGSVNFIKIWNWAELLYWVSRNYRYVRSWTDFLNSSCPAELKGWATERRATHRPENTDIVIS